MGILPDEWKPSLGGAVVYDDKDRHRYLFEQNGDLSIGLSLKFIKMLL